MRWSCTSVTLLLPLKTPGALTREVAACVRLPDLTCNTSMFSLIKLNLQRGDAKCSAFPSPAWHRTGLSRFGVWVSLTSGTTGVSPAKDMGVTQVTSSRNWGAWISPTPCLVPAGSLVPAAARSDSSLGLRTNFSLFTHWRKCCRNGLCGSGKGHAAAEGTFISGCCGSRRVPSVGLGS